MLTQKYNITLLSIYVIAISLLTSLRILYFHWIQDKREMTIIIVIIKTIPRPLTITISIIFLHYVLNTLYTRFMSNAMIIYRVMKLAFIILLVVLWIIGIVLLIVISINLIHGDKSRTIYEGMRIFYFIIDITMVSSIIIILSSYMYELKKYPSTLKNTKGTIYTIFIVIILQLFTKILDYIFHSFNLWFKLEQKSKNIPWYGIVSGLFFLISDMVSLVAYTCFLNQDSEYLKIFQLSETEFVNFAEILENGLTRRISEVTDNQSNSQILLS